MGGRPGVGGRNKGTTGGAGYGGRVIRIKRSSETDVGRELPSIRGPHGRFNRYLMEIQRGFNRDSTRMQRGFNGDSTGT